MKKYIHTTFSCFNKNRIMNKIIKKDGYVYLVEENDAYGRFPTYYNLGKDPDDLRWFENEEKPKKKANKKETSD